jgi:hypothetical protein
MRAVIDNPLSSLKTIIAVEDGKLITGSSQDCDPIVEEVKRMRQVGDGKMSKDLWHAAKFPEVIVETYCNQAGITFSEFMQNKIHVKRMLNDPALSAFRVYQGAL